VLREPEARELLEALETELSHGGRAGDLDGGRLPPTDWLKEVGKGLGLRGRPLFRSVRAALTGRLSGPDLAQVILWLGSEGVHRRLRAARGWN
jgi:hypothetical protein